jgi:hypothetical protein
MQVYHMPHPVMELSLSDVSALLYAGCTQQHALKLKSCCGLQVPSW